MAGPVCLNNLVGLACFRISCFGALDLFREDGHLLGGLLLLLLGLGHLLLNGI